MLNHRGVRSFKELEIGEVFELEKKIWEGSFLGFSQ